MISSAFLCLTKFFGSSLQVGCSHLQLAPLEHRDREHAERVRHDVPLPGPPSGSSLGAVPSAHRCVATSQAAAPTSDPARVYVFDSKACAFDESGAFIEGQPDPFDHPCTYIYVFEQRRTWRHGFSTPFGPSRTTIGEDRGLSSVSCHGTRWR
jgi:hypothetical protein